MPFSEELGQKTYTEARLRPTSDYVKFDQRYRLVLRVLNERAKTKWTHFVQQANGGKGGSINCPNIRSDMNVCPFEASVKHLPKDSEERKEKIARRRFVVNVLDRTPHAECPACGTNSPQTKNKDCISCGTDLSKVDFAPLNKVRLLEQGPRLFNESLNPIVETQAADFDGANITDYDIVFTSQGTGRDRKITALPKNPAPLEPDALLDKETGEPQKLYNLDDLAEPTTLEEINLMIAGATWAEVNAVRGIE